MKLLALEGQFGNMNCHKIEFADPFSMLTLPRGWGEDTLCAFLRVMLYGPNVLRRDLGSLEAFQPAGDTPMMGRLEIEWNGRHVTIERTTKNGAPMQQFEAYYTESGERCYLLTAKNCGQVLLGMSEDDFLSNLWIDGADLIRSESDLQQLLLSMMQTGDPAERAHRAKLHLDAWCEEMEAGDSALVFAEREQAQLEQQIDQLNALTSEIDTQRRLCHTLGEQAEAICTAYEAESRRYEAQLTGEQLRWQNLRADREQRIREIKNRLPDEDLVREAGEVLYGYEGAVQLEEQKRQSMPAIETKRRKAIEQMQQARLEREIEVDRVTRPKIRWVAGLFALIFAVLAAGTGIVQVEWFPQMGQIAGLLEVGHLPIVLSGLAMICLLLTFMGSVQKPPAPLPDMDEERKRIDMEYQQILDEQQMAASVLLEEQERIIAAGRTLSPKVHTVEQATNVIRSALADLQLIRREQSALGDIILEIQRTPEEDPQATEMRENLERMSEERDAAEQAFEEASRQLKMLQTQLKNSEAIHILKERLADCKEQVTKLQKQHDAVCHARQMIQAQNDTMKQKMSPEITRHAQSYLARLTGNTETSQNVWTAADPVQMYLALRLAICEIRTAADAPVFVNRLFHTVQPEDAARGEALLCTIAEQRQVIVLA